MTDPNKALREHLLYLLRGGGAHASFDDVVKGIPSKIRGARAKGAPHTLWQLLEHMRLAQWDILEFSRDPKHVSPEFEQGYWPAGEAPPNDAAWEQSLGQFRRDLDQMQALVENPATDLFAKIPHGEGQTILREALLVADHNAYHMGQMVLVRRLLDAWK